jgi:hypothetical protein
VQLNLHILGSWIASINKYRTTMGSTKADLQKSQPKQLAFFRLFQQIMETAKSWGPRDFRKNVV